MCLIIEYDSIRGTDHVEECKNNQDAIKIKQNGKTCIAVLSDGAGSRKYAEIGAKCVSEAVAEYLWQNINNVILTDKKVLKKNLYDIINKKLLMLADEYHCYSIREFGATLLFAVIKNNSYIIGHLGDGTIIGCYQNYYPVLSFPETGLIKNSTVLTSSVNAKEHLRIKHGEISSIEGMILLSDGILPFLFEQEFVRKHEEPLTEVLNRTKNEKHMDDASYIIIKWR